MESKLPRNLYKKGGPMTLPTGGEVHKYSTVLVKTEEELEVALSSGYIDSFHDAVFGVEKEEVKDEPEKKGLFRKKKEDTFDDDDF